MHPRTPLVAALLFGSTLAHACVARAPAPSVTSAPAAVTSVAVAPAAAPLELPLSRDKVGEIAWTTAGLYTVSESAVQRIDPSNGHVLAMTRLLEDEQTSAIDITEGTVVVRGKKQVRFLHPTTFVPLAVMPESDGVTRISVATTQGGTPVEALAIFPPEGGNVVRIFHRGKSFTLTLGSGEEFAGVQLSEPCVDCGTLAIVSLAGGAGLIVDITSGRRIAKLPFNLGPAYMAPAARVVGEHHHAVLTPDSLSDRRKHGTYQRYNVRTGALEMTIPIPCSTAVDPTPSPDGRQVLFSCDYGDAVLIDVVQRKVRARFKNFIAGCDNGPSLSSYWEPSGKRVHKEGCGGEAIVEIPSGKIVCTDDPHLAGVPYDMGFGTPTPPKQLTVPVCGGVNSWAVVAAPFRRGGSHIVAGEADDDSTQKFSLITLSGATIPLRTDEKVFAYDPTGTQVAVLEETGTREASARPRPFEGTLHLRDAATGARLW